MIEATKEGRLFERIVDTTPADMEAEVAAGRWNPIVIPDDEYDRTRYLGSSNAAPVLGLAPEIKGRRETALAVWNAKRGIVAELDSETQLFLKRRKRWEPVVVQHLREEFDAEVVATNVRYRDPYLPFLAAEIDFEWRDPETGLIEHGEIKTVSPFAFKERFGWAEPWTEDGCPIHYRAQCVHGMMVRGSRKGIVAAMVGIDEMVFYPIVREADTIANMRRAFLRFWNDNVVAGVPPDPMSIKDVTLLHPSSIEGMSVKADSDIGSKALRLRALRGNIDALELESIALEFDVKRAMGDAEKLTVDGRNVFSWKEQKWSRFDQTALKDSEVKAERDAYRKYLKSGKHRVFKPMFEKT